MRSIICSVAIATYNGSRFLREQLDSIIHQTILPNEVIISDDASSDETIEIVESFARSAPFDVKVLRNGANLGYSQNFSRALQACSGDVVFLSDQDDVWLPEKIERVLRCFSERPDAVVVIHDLDYCDEHLVPIGQTKIARMSASGDIARSYVVGMATAIRRGFLQLCLPVPAQPGVAHDRWLHDCALAVNRKVVLNHVLALYRRHGTNATATRAVNVGFVTNRWTFLWARFRESSRIKGLASVPSSPLAAWLGDRRAALVAAGYLSHPEVDTLISRERARSAVVCERHRLLQLPRWQRVRPILTLFRSGGYRDYFSWMSAIKDLLIR